MDIFTSGIFWGSILILIGISVILRIIFNVDIPVFRILFALLLIYWGIKLITGISFKRQPEETVMFGEGKMEYKKEQKEYNVIFGKSLIDLSLISTEEVSKKTEINVVFGSAEIQIDESKPVRIKASSVFGAVNFPDEVTISFGDRVYKTQGFNEAVPYSEVEINVVFGNAVLRRTGASTF